MIYLPDSHDAVTAPEGAAGFPGDLSGGRRRARPRNVHVHVDTRARLDMGAQVARTIRDHQIWRGADRGSASQRRPAVVLLDQVGVQGSIGRLQALTLLPLPWSPGCPWRRAGCAVRWRRERWRVATRSWGAACQAVAGGLWSAGLPGRLLPNVTPSCNSISSRAAAQALR